jgi:carbon-monoxide dehydrogenase iron sulfur subunit
MSQKFIVCDPDKCLGCLICEFACSAGKEKSSNSLFSRIRVVNLEPRGSMAVSCVLCDKTPCVPSCPTGALRRSERGIIEVEEKRCIGCGWCIAACKFGAITLDPNKKVVSICDLCDGDPECVKFCPFEAIVYSTLEEATTKFKSSAMGRLLQELRSGP